MARAIPTSPLSVRQASRLKSALRQLFIHWEQWTYGRLDSLLADLADFLRQLNLCGDVEVTLSTNSVMLPHMDWRRLAAELRSAAPVSVTIQTSLPRDLLL